MKKNEKNDLILFTAIGVSIVTTVSLLIYGNFVIPETIKIVQYSLLGIVSVASLALFISRAIKDNRVEEEKRKRLLEDYRKMHIAMLMLAVIMSHACALSGIDAWLMSVSAMLFAGIHTWDIHNINKELAITPMQAVPSSELAEEEEEAEPEINHSGGRQKKLKEAIDNEAKPYGGMEINRDMVVQDHSESTSTGDIVIDAKINVSEKVKELNKTPIQTAKTSNQDVSRGYSSGRR
jgi:hypothetical protein